MQQNLPDRRTFDRRDELSQRVTIMETTLRMHMAACDERGARVEKVAWLIVTVVVTTLGFLLKVHFFP